MRRFREGTPLEMVKAAGVVGMGRAGFPTGIKLDAHLDHGYILIKSRQSVSRGCTITLDRSNSRATRSCAV